MTKDEEIIRLNRENAHLKDDLWRLISIIEGRDKQDKVDLKYVRLIKKYINNKEEK